MTMHPTRNPKGQFTGPNPWLALGPPAMAQKSRERTHCKAGHHLYGTNVKLLQRKRRGREYVERVCWACSLSRCAEYRERRRLHG